MIHDTWFTNYNQLLSTCFCIGTSQSEMLAKAAVALTILAFQVDNRHEFRCRSDHEYGNWITSSKNIRHRPCMLWICNAKPDFQADRCYMMLFFKCQTSGLLAMELAAWNKTVQEQRKFRSFFKVPGSNGPTCRTWAKAKALPKYIYETFPWACGLICSV